MKDERIIELVNGELDGTNTPSERSELTALLDRDPAAKVLFDEMERMDQMLASVPMVDPPATLKPNVMSAISHREAPARAGESWFERILAPFLVRPAWVAAYAFAIGIIVGLGIFTVVDTSGPEPGMVHGTIGEVHAPVLGRTTIVAGAATADVVVSGLDDELRVDITVTSPDAATLRVASPDSEPIVIESPGGTPVYSLLIQRTTAVSVELSSNDTTDRALLTIDGSK